MEKYAPIKGRVVLSEEEIKLLHEAEKIISEVADFVDEHAHDTALSEELSDLDERFCDFCERIKETRGDLLIKE